MTILTEEIPFTSEGCKIYIQKVEQEMERLQEFYNKYNSLKRRLKLAKKRLESRSDT